MSERLFQILLTIFGGGTFCTGLFAFVEGANRWGIVLTSIGITAMGLLYFWAEGDGSVAIPMSNARSATLFVMLALTWVFLVLDIYDRHYTMLYATWKADAPLETVYGSTRPFANETVELDNRHFIDPVFDNVTFMYEGFGPFQLDNPTLTGRFTVTSHNGVVQKTMEIMHYVEIASGCKMGASWTEPSPASPAPPVP